MRVYWTKENIFMSLGEIWNVHIYPDRDVDDEHFQCEFAGRTKDRDFLFRPIDQGVRAVHSLIRIEPELMPSMVFSLK